jgi:hypothetical protein
MSRYQACTKPSTRSALNSFDLLILDPVHHQLPRLHDLDLSGRENRFLLSATAFSSVFTLTAQHGVRICQRALHAQLPQCGQVCSCVYIQIDVHDLAQDPV